MDNLLLLSMLVATVVAPTLAARIQHGRRALAWTLVLVVVCTLAYVVLVTQYYARHYVPEPFQP